jgi:O-antigen ligase
MTTSHHEHQPTARRASRTGRPLMIALLMLVLIAGFYLLREHWSHVAGNWIYLLLMACPLMHLFHGHGGHGNHDNDRSASGPRGGKEG